MDKGCVCVCVSIVSGIEEDMNSEKKNGFCLQRNRA